MRRAMLRPLLVLTLQVTLPAALLAACDPPSETPDAGPPPGARIVVVKGGDGTGTVSSTPEGVDCDTACADQTHDFAEDVDSVTLVATPARDALFERWSCTVTKDGVEQNPVSATEAELEVFADAEPKGLVAECTATFRQLWTLQVVFSGTGTGRVTGTAPAANGAAGTRIDCPDKCVAGYFNDDEETLTAIPDPGSVFVEWKLDCDGSGPASVTLDEDKNCEAHFCPEAEPDCP